MRAALLVVLALAACKSHREEAPPPPPAPAPAPPPAPTIDRAALLDGKLPDGAPETELINAQCRICHAVEYLTQQRLSEAAWGKTIAKMRKFGANVDDQQAALLAKFAATYWNPDLPGRTFKLVATPAGAVP
ncbi:MAG: hypothetical protein JO257_23010 [Deltaproteobacteria bacterium]|nr:hypothetical protein [Deltaproteobacteria bacterium]